MIAVRTVLSVAAISFVFVVSWFSLRPPSEVFDPSKDIDAICSTETRYSEERELGEPMHQWSIEVPLLTPLPGQNQARTFGLTRNDVIHVEVASPRSGAVAIHGIMEPHVVAVGESIEVKFRAKYSGRFPLHFHGDDGSHFEIAVFAVR